MLNISNFSCLHGIAVVPTEYAKPGFYPTRYCIDATTPGKVRIEVDTFVEQKAAGCKDADEYDPMSYIDAMPPAPNALPLPNVCKVLLNPEKSIAMAPEIEMDCAGKEPGTDSSPLMPAATVSSSGRSASTVAWALIFIKFAAIVCAFYNMMA
jgi:hypothetical protein